MPPLGTMSLQKPKTTLTPSDLNNFDEYVIKIVSQRIQCPSFPLPSKEVAMAFLLDTFLDVSADARWSIQRLKSSFLAAVNQTPPRCGLMVIGGKTREDRSRVSSTSCQAEPL